MRKLYLIIETPKGGELGHRLIASPGFENELEIARISAAASKNLFGPDYFAVSRPTKQILSNGTIRNGTDTIILVGIDTGTLGFEWKRRVKDFLDQLFPKLDELLKDASWLAENRSTIVTRKELNDWVKSDLFRDVPLAPDKNPEPLGPPTINWRFWLYTLFATALMLILLVVWKMLAKNPKVDPSPSKPNLKAQLKALGDDWKCTPNDVAISFVRVKNWDSKTMPVEGKELQNSDVVFMLKSLDGKKGKERLQIALKQVKVATDHGDFNKEMENDGTCMSFRENLYKIWAKFKDLTEKTKKITTMSSKPTPTLQLFLDLKNLKLNINEDKFREPKTPLLDLQDMNIYDAVKIWRNIIKDRASPVDIEIIKESIEFIDKATGPTEEGENLKKAFLALIEFMKALKEIEPKEQK